MHLLRVLVDGGESNDILIANAGTTGESNAIHLGTQGTQTTAFIAGISGATSASGVPVLVAANGQLGTQTSSRRYKRDIRDMGEQSRVLMALRPVSFRYNPELDPDGAEQYGLIAEEVAQVAPDLVVTNARGEPETVRYSSVNAMLLNEVQRQEAEIRELKERLARLEKALAR